jgi:antitoxin component YwqK of YwqJK toxin-antitoxin module
MNIDEIYEKKIVHFQSIKNNISKLLKMFHIKTSVSFNKICYYDNEKKSFVIEDVKSSFTKKLPAYIIKRKLVKKFYPDYIFIET